MPNYALLSRIIRSAVFEDWPLKFISLLLAVLMWFYIDGELTDQRDLVVSLRPADIELPKGYELSPEHSLPKYNVRVRGTRRRLQLMGPESISFKKRKLDAPQPGLNALNFQASDLEADGFSILGVSPKDENGAVEVLVTTSQLKQVRVKSRGDPKPGYLIGQAGSEPEQVSVLGSDKDLALINFVWTEPVDVTDADQDVVREAAIQPYVDHDGRRISLRCGEKVRATVSVHAVAVTRRLTLEVHPLVLPGLALSVEPKTLEVEVAAEERLFASPEFIKSVVLYVEWPAGWEKPADAQSRLGPVDAQVRAVSLPGVQVRGKGGAALPTVKVSGGLCGAVSSN